MQISFSPFLSFLSGFLWSEKEKKEMERRRRRVGGVGLEMRPNQNPTGLTHHQYQTDSWREGEREGERIRATGRLKENERKRERWKREKETVMNMNSTEGV